MSDNPYATPETMTVTPERRAIWTKELKSARVILIIVGIIQLCMGVYLITNLKSTIEAATKAEVAKMGPGYYFDQAKFDEEFEKEKDRRYALSSIPVVFGIYFLVMAVLVFKFPIGVTLSSLILFVLGHVADAVVDPAAIGKGIILKIVFIAILWKAFQSARTARAAVGNE